MSGTYWWVIEACESPVFKPNYLVGASSGRCFFLWTDEYQRAKKFNSKNEAFMWIKQNRLNCGFRVCEHGE